METKPMLVTDEVRAYIGVATEAEFACDAVEAGAVRRFAQGIMDEDPAYQAQENEANRRIKPLAHLATLNGGSEFEFFRYARHGERVSVRLSYADITEKQTSKGPMVLVVRLYEFRTEAGDLLMRSRMTSIRRPA
jgi:hypothetical protein